MIRKERLQEGRRERSESGRKKKKNLTGKKGAHSGEEGKKTIRGIEAHRPQCQTDSACFGKRGRGSSKSIVGKKMIHVVRRRERGNTQ